MNRLEKHLVTNSPYRRIAVAIDDSPAAQAALSIALAIVAPHGKLAFVHAIDRALVVAEIATPYGADASPALEAFEQDERDIFTAAIARATAHRISSTTYSLDGRADSRIADFVRTGRFDAVVLGTRAHRGLARLILGSTAETVLRASPAPTFITSEQNVSRIASGIGQLLVAIDGSEPALAAVRCAIALAQHCDAGIVFAHVAENDTLHDLQAEQAVRTARQLAARADVQSDTVTLHGRPDEALIAAAESICADLIIIGTHGRTGFARIRLGSIAEAVIRMSSLPVMAVPSGAGIAPDEVPIPIGAL